MRELTDDEVFGAAKRELSDDEVFGAASPNPQVGVMEAGKRGAAQGWGSVNQWAGNMAMLPVIGAEVFANLFRDKPDFSMSEWGAQKFVTPFEQMQQEAAIKNGEDVSGMGIAANVLGNIVGQAPAFAMPMAPANQAPRMLQQAAPMVENIGNLIARGIVQAQPLAQTAMVQRSNQLQAGGVPDAVANDAALAGYGINALGYGLPVGAMGNVFKRAVTGAGANIVADVPAVQSENDILNAAGYGHAAHDPFSIESMATTGGVGAAMAALLGQRAPRMQTAESVAAGRAMDAQREADANAAALDASIVPDSGISVADMIRGQVLNEPAAPDVQKQRRADAATTLGAKPEDPIIYKRDTMDPVTGEMLPATERGTGQIATDPERLAAQREAQSGWVDLTPEQTSALSEFNGLSPDDIAALSPAGRTRLWEKFQQAQQADAERGTLVTTFGEEPLSSPASKPDVPGDRLPGRGEYEDRDARMATTPEDVEAINARAATQGTDAAQAAAAKKSKMTEKLDELRRQKDALDDNEVRADLKRKADMGLGMTDKERKAHAAFTEQRAKLDKSIFDLEGRIYDTEARSELGSKTATGTSDRPFRMDDVAPDSFEAAARPEAEARARAKAAEEEQAAIDRMEAEWRERQRMRRQEEAQQQAGQRKQESQQEQQAQQKYAGKKGTTREAPLEGGKFKADESGFVMSDNGSPLQFGHQRDAGWWILKRGNKGNTGQVFEIANHPSGKGYTVRVTKDSGGGDGAAAGRSGDSRGAGDSGMGGSNLVPRGDGNRGTDQRGRVNPGSGESGRSPIQDGALANASRQDAPLRDRDADSPEIANEVIAMAANAGLSEKGGYVIRDPVSGDVVGKTKAVPREDWWLNRPHTDRVGKRGKVTKRFTHDEAEFIAAGKAYAEGKPLTKRQRDIITFLRAVAEEKRDEQRAWREGQENLDNLPTGGKIEDVPRPFLERIEVEAPVHDPETGKWSREQTNARVALDTANEDVAMYRRLIDCLGR